MLVIFRNSPSIFIFIHLWYEYHKINMINLASSSVQHKIHEPLCIKVHAQIKNINERKGPTPTYMFFMT